MVEDEKEEAPTKKFFHKVRCIHSRGSSQVLALTWRGSQGPQVGKGADPIRIAIYYWILDVRLISDLIIQMGYV